MRQWNETKSLILSKVLVVLFAIALLALDIEGYFLARLFTRMRGMSENAVMLFCATIYAVSVPGWGLLAALWKLLGNIGRQLVFLPENVTCLRAISWCCAAASVICLASGVYYPPFLLIAVAAVFMMLIVRIVKNCFEQAIRMKNELDYTV